MKKLLVIALMCSYAHAKEAIVIEDGYQPWLAGSGNLYFYTKDGEKFRYNKLVCRSEDPSKVGLVKSVAVQSLGGKPIADNSVVILMNNTPFTKPGPELALISPQLCVFGEALNKRAQQNHSKGEPI